MPFFKKSTLLMSLLIALCLQTAVKSSYVVHAHGHVSNTPISTSSPQEGSDAVQTGDLSLIPSIGKLGDDCNFMTGNFKAFCIPLYIGYLIGLIFYIAGALFLLIIIISGYRIALGSLTGDKETGKKQLSSAIIGFIVTALAFFIIDFIVGSLAGAP